MYNILALINKGIKENKKYINIPYSLLNLKIIKLLYEKGYLLNYRLFYNKIKIELNIYENNLIFLNIFFYKNLQMKKFVTYKQLKRLTFVKKKKLLLSTSKGILLNEIALKYRIGGCILIEFN